MTDYQDSSPDVGTDSADTPATPPSGGTTTAVAERPSPVKGQEKTTDFDWYTVHLTHPNHHDRIVFRSVSEARARAFVERRFPRGSEAYIKLPDGSLEHYEHERTGEYGVDIEQWQPFNPADWIAPEQQAPPGESAWSDKEG